MSKKDFSSLKDDSRNFWKLIKESKFMKLGIFFNILWLSLTIFGYFGFKITGNLDNTAFSYDFSVFFTAGNLIRSDPTNLYSSALYNLPFRYLPSFAYMYIWTSFLTLPTAYIITVLFTWAINFLNTFLVYVITKKFYSIPKEQKRWLELIAVFFIGPVQIVNYIFGQISPLFIFFLLSSLFFLENNRNHKYNIRNNNLYAGISLGFAITFKPFAALIVPFLISIKIGKGTLNQKKIQLFLKPTFSRLFGIFIILGANLIFFIFYPNTFADFLDVNFVNTLEIHHSTSFTRLFTVLCGYFHIPCNKVIILFGLLLIFYPITYYRFVISTPQNTKYAFFYQEAMLIMMLVYIDSWFLYFVIWFAFLVPTLSNLYEKFESNKKEYKLVYIIHRLANFCMEFFVFGVVLYYFVIGIDPITPLILLMVYILEQILFWKELKIKKNEIE